jgi:hypothetical protein
MDAEPLVNPPPGMKTITGAGEAGRLAGAQMFK